MSLPKNNNLVHLGGGMQYKKNNLVKRPQVDPYWGKNNNRFMKKIAKRLLSI